MILNQFLIHRKFKMETWRSIVSSLDQGDMLASADLSHAYLHLMIHLDHCRFLRFCYGHRHLQYRSLPFGLTTAPRVFSKVLVALVAHLRLQGVFIYPYLDDLLLKSSSRAQACHDISRMLECLQSHGFVVNFAKSSLIPSQRIEHLGLLLDTQTASFSLSPDRQRKLLAALKTALQAPSQSVTFLAKLLGLLVSC